MQRYFFSLIMLLTGVANVQADTALEGHVFRIEPFYGPVVTVLDDGWDEHSTTGSTFGVIGSFQASQGFYAQMGFSSEYVDEGKIDGETYDIDESFSARTLGVGYRFAVNREQGRFWGIATAMPNRMIKTWADHTLSRFILLGFSGKRKIPDATEIFQLATTPTHI